MKGGRKKNSYFCLNLNLNILYMKVNEFYLLICWILYLKLVFYIGEYVVKWYLIVLIFLKVFYIVMEKN